MPITKSQAKSSQEFVPIKEIRDGVVILEDGTTRMTLMASSLNFALKSTEGQEAIINQYQDFLNSLDFSVQFFIQSRRLNIEPYLDSLRNAEKAQVNELLKLQIKEYVEFVKNFVGMTEIVSKTFYVIIPFSPPTFGKSKGGSEGSPLGGIFGSFLGKKAGKTDFKEDKFEEYKSQLQQRVETVIQGLTRTGIRAVPLNTEELIELFYTLYNPGELAKGGIAETQK
ncbi:MAG: hypothetical protein COY22_00295 [Candidatus Tagabacteria bacterium CG_4_10_14_0_2_um_filter_40_13]|uniref:TraC-like domain-containing protein n=2 Tax=Candidatus Tagaibacteriota TaxID=1817918 RepID=A0A2M7B8S1_9BACT|nr:MAG: hypothetical protein COV90_00215 [Candidatus Tagabacteria bacterium CG11_big_fil_rev_8_21_14_0_20_41_11]PIU99468.1 MAG: hypothetical protein COS58_02230 [Candidatus Tagabacteria bacterium CG03_land_8_20_14_0_80_41_22]PIZ56730.1 MAG: hypothetical protein COY22_00295 [Candidatus Tagabacteria bacterium CG_4_10_14_0_2_um_filter_40_13]PJC25098.1 MAG: hypothetical protein CO056_02115 [Candidatus Tagabacteria bacterium CG_4_9_14_0_2_um_filter_41_11]